jgi:hypothetical protein
MLGAKGEGPVVWPKDSVFRVETAVSALGLQRMRIQRCMICAKISLEMMMQHPA